MGCCGEKRKKWLNEVKSSTSQTTNEMDDSKPDIKNQAEKHFEYTGNRPLSIKGVFSGKTYFFKEKGVTVKVEYHDSFALKAERNLKMILP